MEVNDSGVSVQTAKPDEADSSIVASSSPVVFQCTQCNTIVGDSTAWVTSNELMRTITLGRVTSKVGVNSNIQISESGIDKGSTFSTVFCMSCKEVLGKQYMASPPDLDYIRGRFTFHVEKLNRNLADNYTVSYLEQFSYLVGSAEKLGKFDLADMLNIPSPDYIMARMSKMQFLIVSMNDRIKNLEACLNTGESDHKLPDNFTRQSTLQGETESVSSTDHFSTRPRSDSFHSAGTDDTVTHQGEDGVLNREESFMPWHNNESIKYDQAVDQQTREKVRKSNTVSEKRSSNRNLMLREGVFQQLSSRLGQHENFTGPDDNPVHGNNNKLEESDNMYINDNSRRISSNGRKEQIEKERRNSGNERQSSRYRAQGQHKDLQRSNWNNVNQSERSGSHIESTTPSENRSVPRKQVVMETWPSPGVERTGRENKKRKL